MLRVHCSARSTLSKWDAVTVVPSLSRFQGVRLGSQHTQCDFAPAALMRLSAVASRPLGRFLAHADSIGATTERRSVQTIERIRSIRTVACVAPPLTHALVILGSLCVHVCSLCTASRKHLFPPGSIDTDERKCCNVAEASSCERTTTSPLL